MPKEKKEKKEKILKRLDQYRAIEINNLWQRSVFLGTFLILGYTGYGFLLDKMLAPSEITFVLNNITLTEKYESSLELYHFIACALACINILFSTLWIAMAKGSKAWYEAYENAIRFVEDSNKSKFSWKEIREKINLKNGKSNGNGNKNKSCCKKFCCIISFKKEKKNIEEKKNDCLFSTKAGGYSPSKINIAIGQISLIIWTFVMSIHIFFIILHLNLN